MQCSALKQNRHVAQARPVTASSMAGSASFQQLARNKGSYDGLVCLQLLAKGELQWWISNIHQVNGSLIHPPSCEMTITSDASKLGWGAACGLQTTKGSSDVCHISGTKLFVMAAQRRKVSAYDHVLYER